MRFRTTTTRTQRIAILNDLKLYELRNALVEGSVERPEKSKR